MRVATSSSTGARCAVASRVSRRDGAARAIGGSVASARRPRGGAADASVSLRSSAAALFAPRARALATHRRDRGPRGVSARRAGRPGAGSLARASAGASSASSDDASPSSSGSGKPLRVAISGASGFVGTRLVAKLLAGGHDVVVLTRDVQKARLALRDSFSRGTIAFVDPSNWAAAVPGCDGVVNLAGEPISTRWSPAIKAEIMASRLKATKRIADAIAACPESSRPKTLVNASAVGFYGASASDETFDETAPAGGDYLSKVCQAWEKTAEGLERDAPGVRVVLLRLGIVLDRDGGALGKMLPTFQIFAGGPMGDGAQWFSWIHREDAVGIVVEALTNESMRGPVNVTAPNPVRMGEMCAALGRTLGRPSWLPVPDFAVTALLGEGATVVLQGQKVKPNAALAAGYKFKYERIDDALQDILR